MALKLTYSLSKWDEPNLTDTKYQQWESTLDNINDTSFVYKCCVETFAPSSAKFIRKALSYARKRLDAYQTDVQVTLRVGLKKMEENVTKVFLNVFRERRMNAYTTLPKCAACKRSWKLSN